MNRILILAEEIKDRFYKEIIFCLTRMGPSEELSLTKIGDAIHDIAGVINVEFKDYTIIVTVGRAFDAYEIKKEVIKVLKKKVFSDAENVEVWIEYETGDEPLKISDSTDEEGYPVEFRE